MSSLLTGEEFAATLIDLGVTHVVWVPDSDVGPWEPVLEAADQIQLVRVCREGEAWPLAAGLQLGGACPVVLMQTTGLFESGDALRNTLFDLQRPLLAVIGARNWLVRDSQDTARRFAEPILRGWGVPYTVIEKPEQKSRLADRFREALAARQAAFVLLAEGPG